MATILRFPSRRTGVFATIELTNDAPTPPRPPEPDEGILGQVAEVTAWLDEKYDLLWRLPRWHAMTPAEQALLLRDRMDNDGRRLNLDTIDRRAWRSFLPALERRAINRALLETHRIVRHEPATDKE